MYKLIITLRASTAVRLRVRRNVYLRKRSYVNVCVYIKLNHNKSAVPAPGDSRPTPSYQHRNQESKIKCSQDNLIEYGRTATKLNL